MTKKSFTYALYKGKKKVYIGKTDDLEKRQQEHKNNNKKFTRIEKTSRKMSEESAQQRETEQLKRYRYGHGGKNPEYNKTNHG